MYPITDIACLLEYLGHHPELVEHNRPFPFAQTAERLYQDGYRVVGEELQNAADPAPRR